MKIIRMFTEYFQHIIINSCSICDNLVKFLCLGVGGGGYVIKHQERRKISHRLSYILEISEEENGKNTKTFLF